MAQQEDGFIHFTPDKRGFDIMARAEYLAWVMAKCDRPMVMHLEHGDARFEKGCAALDIIGGYLQAMRELAPDFVPAQDNTGWPEAVSVRLL